MDAANYNSSTTLVTLLVGLVVYYHYKMFTFWSSRGIGGPIPWPIFGTNIYYVFYNKVELDLKWRKMYGKTYGLYEGYSPLLRTTDADIIKQVFLKQFHSFTDRNCRFINTKSVRNWLLWTRGNDWANKRALVSPIFTANKMRTMMPIMMSCVNRFMEEVERRSSKSGNVVWNKVDLSSLTLDAIASSVFGLRLETYKPENEPQDPFIEAAYRFAEFDVGRFFLWLFVPRQVARAFAFDAFAPERIAYFESLAKKVVKERKAANAQKRNDFVQALIETKVPDQYEKIFSKLDESEAHYNARTTQEELEQIQMEQTKQATKFRSFSDLEICGQMIFFLVAGFETTAHTLSAALHELANQPVIQTTLLDELKACLKTDSGELREVCYEDLLNLEYLNAFISELLRMYSPILENNRRVTNPDGVKLDVGNGKQVHLPLGLPISVNSFIIHRDEEYFEQPLKFDIRRFYKGNKDNIKTGTFMPFGLGPRHCAGMRFALLEIKLALAKFILKYSIEPTTENIYPPKFKQNAVFLQFVDNSFRLVVR